MPNASRFIDKLSQLSDVSLTSPANGDGLFFNPATHKWENKTATSVSGYSGYSGFSGFSGYSGNPGGSGFSGYSGKSGYSGYSGLSGFSGYSGATGPAGISGFSGYSGAIGSSGFSGYSGAIGSSGISGFSGTGTSGFSGYSGISGISGFSGVGTSGFSGYSGAGASGFSGYSGISGFSGYSGSVGISGFSGYSGVGSSGFSGYSGAVGTSGFSGYSGAVGTSGFSGYSGAVGTSGFSGYSGAGSSGFSGYSGATGLSGLSGFSGYSGANGVSGFSGYSGKSGYSGFSGSGISGFSGYSGAGTSGFSGYSGAGTSGFSGYSGSGSSGFSGYSGYSGYSGALGTSGFSGYSGTSGFSGYSGGTGSSGFSGYSGTVGASGFSGYSGGVGASGFSGYSGTSGFSGHSGGAGASGFSGYSGAVGLSGFSGYSGPAGANGTSGFSGYSGSGVSGFSGYSGFSGQANTTIGPPEDGTYTDGLFTDFVDTTPTGTAIDRFNEVLKQLAPSPAPVLSSASLLVSSNVAGNLSFGASHTIAGYSNVAGIGAQPATDADGTFVKSGKRQGVTATITGISGVLADTTSVDSGSPTPSYPANSFGDADQGNLILEVNGSIVRTVDLTVLTAVNDASTGFVLSAATNNKFSNGSSFTIFNYRTGIWKAASGNFRNGWNYIRVRHQIPAGGSTYRDVGYMDFVYDADVTAASFASESITGWTGGSPKTLSGVSYYTTGTGTYAITVSNAFKNTYTTTNSLVFNRSNTTNIQAIAAQNYTVSSPSYEAATTAASKTVNLATSGIRIINGSITITTTANRTVQSAATSTGASVSGLLIDNIADSETNLVENFSAESKRIASNADFTSITTDANWTSSNTIADAGSTGYNDGLQVTNGTLVYPSINYSTITNGPAGNVNYSTGVTGARTFYRVFKPASGSTGNFSIILSGSGVTFIPVTTAFTNNSGQMKLEFTAPSQTGWLDAYQDFSTGNFTTGSGGRNSGAGVGRALATTWGLTIGTQSTANSGGRIFVRITVPQGFTGNLSNITFAFL
jgi:hypothetical protein